MLLLLFLILQLVSGFILDSDDYHRRVSLELNPGLNSSVPPGVSLLHIQARGANDTLHFLFCSLGAPTLLLVHTNSTSSSVKVDWPQFLSKNDSGSLQVEPRSSVQYSSALVFTRLWEYEDVNNTADPQNMPSSSFFPPYELQSFTWGDLNKTLNSTAHTAQLCGGDGTSSFSNGSLCLTISAFESVGRDHIWPRLLHNANSSQIHVWLKGVTARSNYSRFSLELQTVGSRELPSRVDVVRSIDDEYTPSIFQVSEWVSSPVNSTSPVLGYSQWKPVAYRTAAHILEGATPCRHSSPQPMAQLPPSGLVKAYFGDGYQTSGLNITFGIAGDPFYSVTNYLSWTVMVGLGSPPVDSFSPLVIVIMAVGLGTPLVLILLGGVCVCIRKRQAEPLAYEPIN
ncbi:glycosylated lysosomal membrane protein [Megalops cyprinoides]|uniref:glycosylated lysosomal membrane protein n=1 Tax=Megalops cyprinoides TaxID=118141 RepID=UPI0018641E49|nr:glycosylated lysosomal membrane protein [Megalops cyprinoides]